jgi:hypothetical protein
MFLRSSLSFPNQFCYCYSQHKIQGLAKKIGKKLLSITLQYIVRVIELVIRLQIQQNVQVWIFELFNSNT